MRSRLGVTLIFAAAIAAPACGWSTPPPAVAPPSASQTPAPSAEATSLVKRYFVAIQLDKRMDALLDSLLPFQIDEESRSIEGLTPEQKAAVVAATSEAAKEWFPKYIDEVAEVYAQVFTVDELRALVSFYESPLGQTIVAKSGQLAPEAVRLMRQDLPDLRASMRQHLCRRLDCTKLKRRPVSAAA
jgi:hypothetical protein